MAHASSTSSPQRRPTIGHLPGLDGIRALAVIAVVVYHADSSWLPGGFLGVEVFFVLSGFLITRLLVVEHTGTGRVDLRGFWLRRARRLMPAMFMVLVGVVVVTATMRPDAAGQVRGDVVAALAYASNWYQIVIGAGYAASGDFAPLRHLWSLAIEEQFYVVWPFVLVVLLRREASRVLIAILLVVVAAGVAGAVAAASLTGAGVDALYLSTPSRSSGLLLGAALGLLGRGDDPGPSSPSVRRRVVADVAGLTALTVLVVMSSRMWFLGDEAHPLLFRGGFLIVDVATVILIVAVTGSGRWVTRVHSLGVLRWVGTRSYGLYLVHWPVFQLVRRVAGVGLTPIEFVGAVVVSVGLAEISYRMVEMPVRSLGWKGAVRRGAQLGGVGARSAFAAVTVVAVVAVSGSVFRLATAEVLANELEAGLDAAASSVTDLDVLLVGVEAPGRPATDGPPEAAASPGSVVPAAPSSVAPGAAPSDPSVRSGSPSSATVPPETVTPETVTPETVTPETVTPETVPPDARIPMLAIGDSVMLGAAAELSASGWVVNAVRSRQVWDVTEMLALLGLGGFYGDVVAVHLGTNGPVSDEALDEVLAALEDVPVVVLLTVRARRSWSAGNSERIRQRAGGNVVVVDWAVEADRCPGNCFMDDGIHLRPAGREFYARLVTEAAARRYAIGW